MDLRRLKYFVKIVNIGSLTQVAEVLHIAQSTLSQQVATPEGEMDQQLLIRTRRGVTSTEAGRILYTYAWTILRQCEQTQLAVNNVGQTLHDQVLIGLALGTAAPAITMPLLQMVRNGSSEVMVYLQENSGTALNDKLLVGRLDMAMLYERSPVAGTVSQPLLEEDFRLVNTRGCLRQSVDLTAMAEMNLFLPRGYGAVRARVTEAFTLRRPSTRIIGGIEFITTLTAAVASGMGVTVLPEPTAHSLYGAASGWVVRVGTPSMSLLLSLNMLARGSLSPQAQAAKKILLSLVSHPLLENRELQLVSQAILS